jgi:hypothetical protein
MVEGVERVFVRHSNMSDGGEVDDHIRREMTDRSGQQVIVPRVRPYKGDTGVVQQGKALIQEPFMVVPLDGQEVVDHQGVDASDFMVAGLQGEGEIVAYKARTPAKRYFHWTSPFGVCIIFIGKQGDCNERLGETKFCGAV